MKRLVGRIDSNRSCFYTWLTGISGAIATISVLLAGASKLGLCLDEWLKVLVVGFWVVAPPLWLWFEWFFLEKPAEPSGAALERIKYGQSVVRALWAAVVAVLAIGFDFV